MPKARSPLVAALVAIALLRGTCLPAGAQGQPEAGSKLTRDLDTVMTLSPPDSCLTVSIDGEQAYDHRGTDPQIPASNEKLRTAATALDTIGADVRYETRLVTAAPISGGVVQGDVYLIGDGDPTLVSSLYRAVRRMPPDRPLTLLDDMADQLAQAGITRIDGRVIGDESRYDTLRVVPSWPERHANQNQSGPLSALTVDGGYLLEPDEDGELDRVRSKEPATDAARAFVAVLSAKHIAVAGEPTRGTAPAGAAEVAKLASAPMGELVGDMLRRSDNQMAELILKELGVVSSLDGSSAAGARAVSEWSDRTGVATPGAFVVDGSGLDRGNQLSCRELVAILDQSGGVDGPIGSQLAVAGESGTLRGRFTTSDAVGRLRAKTGSINGVTSLAGFVETPEGQVATFAFIANGDAVDSEVMRAQDYLAQILASYLPPCPEDAAGSLDAPAADLIGLGAITPYPIALAGPGMIASLRALETEADRLLDRCSREAEVTVDLGAH